MARKLSDGLDHDGAEPDHELDNQTNELHLAKAADGRGGWIKGRLDSVTFDELVQLIEAFIKSRTESGKTLPERQADALGEVLERVLDYDDELPETAGSAPHLTVIIEHEKLQRGLRGASLTATGCRIGPKEIRRIACVSGVIPLLLGSQSEPLDVGRQARAVSRYQRAALAVRDGGCAHPGCATAAKWCQVHHIIHWINHGNTDLNNLVLLCRTHHQMIHHSGWVVRIRDGWPEFIPPKWIDPEQKPRRKTRPLLLTL
jgi:5-methylcytosine-specific restriction protein A